MMLLCMSIVARLAVRCLLPLVSCSMHSLSNLHLMGLPLVCYMFTRVHTHVAQVSVRRIVMNWFAEQINSVFNCIIV